MAKKNNKKGNRSHKKKKKVVAECLMCGKEIDGGWLCYRCLKEHTID